MKCPFCGYSESKVIDSRPAEEGATIRRRRECLACQKRFTTYEIIERLPLVVVKRDGSRQTFDRVKLINGMVRACEKRPVSLPQLESIADDIEQELQSSLEREVSTVAIGEMVMSRLKEVDEVAYVRFASVYRSFKDINTFLEELTKLLSDKEGLEDTAQTGVLHPLDAVQVIAQLVVGGAAVPLAGEQLCLQFIEGVGGGVDLRMADENVGVAVGLQPAVQGLVQSRLGGKMVALFIGGLGSVQSGQKLPSEAIHSADVPPGPGHQQEQQRAGGQFTLHVLPPFWPDRRGRSGRRS